MHSLSNVAIIGGGRWARVIAEEIYKITLPDVGISVHSPRNADKMTAWVEQQKMSERIHVFPDWPQFDSKTSTAAIIANAARDHELAAERILTAGIPVLVEKPITLSTQATRRLSKIAQDNNGIFAAAHVLIFASYMETFSSIVRNGNGVHSIKIMWMDPKTEERYGDSKHYDSGLPIYADCIPHVISLLSTIHSIESLKCNDVSISGGGSNVSLDMSIGSIPVMVQLIRNGDRRIRSIDVVCESASYQIDFSVEPGTICIGPDTLSGDPNWSTTVHPLARMLTAYLKWAGGGEHDPKLDIGIGLIANQVIDQASTFYWSEMKQWLIDRLASNIPMDEELLYSLSEVLQAQEYLPADTIERKTRHIMRYVEHKHESECRALLSEAGNPAEFSRVVEEMIFSEGKQ